MENTVQLQSDNYAAPLLVENFRRTTRYRSVEKTGATGRQYVLATEKQLLLQIVRGNEQAFRQFYTGSIEYVTQVANVYCGKSAIAVEDIVQEVFLAVWKYRANLEHVDNIRFYLFTITKNKVLTFQRKEAKNRRMPLHEAHAALFIEEPFIAFDYKRMLGIFRQTLNTLPQRQKKVFQLRYHHGLSGPEVGQLLGITHCTVKNLNRMARRKLLNALRKDGVM